ncbi:MAG TPA: hypothetical protein VF223_13000 [Trebonia sp.]
MDGPGGTQTQTGDPAINAFNQIFNREFSSGLRAAGGLTGITAPRPLAMPSQLERDILGRITNFGQTPLFSTSAGSPFQQIVGALTPTAQQTFERVVSPQILNQMTAGGFTPGSGAITEALANAGANLSNQVLQQAAGLTPQAFAQQLAGLQTALGAAGAPRQAQLAEESRLGDVLLQILGRGPMASGAGTATTTTERDLFGPLTSLAGTGLLAFALCWVARAIYGEDDPRWRYARHFIFNIWSGPVARMVQRLYCRYGRQVAPYVKRSRVLKALLRPLFDIAVRKGQAAQRNPRFAVWGVI